jgi:hypothetical protein
MKWIVGVSLVAVFVGMAATMTIPAQTITPDQAILRLFPSETHGIAFFDVAALRNAPLVQEALTQRTVPPRLASRLGELEAATGFKPERDVDRVTVGRLGAGEMLAIVEARYDKFKFEQFLNDKGLQSEAYMGRSVYVHDKSAVSFIDNLIIAGNNSGVKKAIEQLSLPGGVLLGSDLMNAIQAIESGNQVWGVGQFSIDRLPSRLAGRAGTAGPALELLKTLQGGTYQMRVDQDVHARATGSFSSADSAKTIGDMARGFIALAKFRVASQADLLHALDGVQIQNSGSSVVVSIEEPGDLLKKLRDSRKLRQ